MEGLIIRSLGGFYTVESEDGTRTECRGRGIFRKDATTLLVGDRCTFEPTEPGCGSITAIAPRKNILQRPPVANLDRLALVVSLADPAPNALVLDKLITVCEYKGIEPVILITKTDLDGGEDFAAIYQKAKDNLDGNIVTAATLDEMKAAIADRPRFVKAMWCGDRHCEEVIKEETGMPSRCIPFQQEKVGEVCPVCGRPAKKMVVFGIAY